MAQAFEGVPSQREPHSTDAAQQEDRLAGAPWPLVERRAQVRPVPQSAVGMLLRQPHTAAPPRRADRPHAPLADRARLVPLLLLGDLLGVVGLLASGSSSRTWVLVVVAWCCVLVEAGAPSARTLHVTARRLSRAGGVLVLVVGTAAYATELALPQRQLLLALPLAVLLSAGSRALVAQRLPVPVRLLLVGTVEAVQAQAAFLGRARGRHVHVVGACCPTAQGLPAVVAGVPVLGDLEVLADREWRETVDQVVVCSTEETSGPTLRKLLWDVEDAGVEVCVAPGIVELGGDRLRLDLLAGLPVLVVQPAPLHGWRRWVKHTLDRTVALLALVCLLPLLLALSLAVRRTSPGTAFYRQRRVGRHGEDFTLYKFRTMYGDAEQRVADLQEHNKHEDGPLFKMAADPRVTPLGHVLRRWSLDELPQLINVVKGEMSLVGPRPPLPGEVARYGDAVPRRLLVRPGLTGLWQVSGRSDLTWDESTLLDLRYVENWSLRMDLRILLQTFGAVVRGRGAY